MYPELWNQTKRGNERRSRSIHNKDIPKQEWLCIDGIRITGKNELFLITNDDVFVELEPEAFRSPGKDLRIIGVKGARSARETLETFRLDRPFTTIPAVTRIIISWDFFVE